MKSPINTSTTNNKLSFILALWLGFTAITGLSGCGSSSSKDPYLTISNPSVNEGNTAPAELLFTVTLSETVDQTVTLDYTVVDDTAVAGDDYSDTVTSGQLTIPAGSTEANVSIYTIEDTDFEQDETLNLVVSNAQGVTLDAASYTGQGTITNDDTAEPKGYFTGTATLNSTDYTDITALVYDNRVLMFSPTANVLYDIAMTPALGAYSGSVEVYVDGQIEQVSAVTVTGTTDGAQLTGTFSGGTGLANGSFDMAFDTSNNKGATLGRIEAVGLDEWTGYFYGYDVDTGRFSSDSMVGYFGTDATIERCYFFNTFDIPNPDISIYKMSHALERQSVGNCTAPYESTGHSGFAAVVDDTGTDDMMVFAFNNDNIALFGIMHH